MATFKRILSFVMAFVLVLGMVPVGARAEETEPTETVAETTAPAEETTMPAETETEPTEGTTVPVEETTVPATEPVVLETVESASQEAAYSVVDSGTCGDNLTWELDSEGTLTISGTGDMWDYECYVDDAPWYYSWAEIMEVVIQPGITSIGNYAFYYCSRMTSITIPDSVTSIGASVFSMCEDLISISIPSSVTHIGQGAFQSSGLTSVTIPEGVASIGDFAFGSCGGLSSVTIPASVTDIGDAPFHLCNNLVEIQVQSGNAYYYSDASGVLYNKSKTVLIQAPGMLSGSYSIPDSVTSIGVSAFAGCSYMTTVALPDKLTSIGNTAFHGCIGLTSITIPESVSSIGESTLGGCTQMVGIQVESGNAHYTSDSFGVLYDKDKTTLIQAPGKIAEEYTIPSSVTTIGDHAFFACIHFEDITIPNSVTSIGNYAFCYCYKMADIYFEGDAPEFGDGVFLDNTTTAHYPANNPTWTEEVKQNYGGRSVMWVSDGPVHHNTLGELTELDYLAFSAIAYLPLGSSGTIKKNLEDKGYWDDIWSEDQNITYGQLCKHIAQWEIVTDYDLSDYNGFYAKPFTNNNGEIVIAYRGSVPPGEWNLDTNWDFFCDWLLNDLPLEIGNTMGIQLDDALEIYNNIARTHDKSKIVTTGHSLGGAWATVASAYSGCKAVTFNSVSVLDVLYAHDPEMMGKLFDGVDKWNFVDHTNQYDVLAGMFEKFLSTEMKPYVAHKSIVPIGASAMEMIEGLFDDFAGKMLDAVIEGTTSVFQGGLKAFIIKSLGKTLSKAVLGDIAACHSLQSYVIKTADGDVQLTKIDSTFSPKSKITNYMLTANHSVDFGTSGTDKVSDAWTILVPRTSFGGNGNDTILTSWQKDHIIGGRGSKDILDGSWGNDTYIYYPGDGYDIIKDVSGCDVLIISGEDSRYDLDCKLSSDGKFVNIYCNGENVVSIFSDGRAEGDNSFKVNCNGVEMNVTAYLKTVKYSSTIGIHCPVNVEVLDANGNVVYTLVDGEVGNWYTDYGNFYVFEEEEGGYGKVLDLVEGYSARIVGVDDGTMKIDYREVVDGQLAEPKNFVDVPITPAFTATFEETEDGELVLAADTDGDDVVDVKLGYDGKPVPVESVVLAQEYLALKPEQTAQLVAEVQPAELTEFITWSVEQDEEIITVDESGNVTAQAPGTAYVLATVSVEGVEMTARCRVDVAEAEVVEEVEKIKLDGIQLGTTKLTSELYSTDYPEFDILLKLPQNYPTAGLTASRSASMSSAETVDTSPAIDSAVFDDDEMNDLFELRVLDDRRVQIVPREDAISAPKEVKGKYSSTVTVTVQGKEWTSEEVLTLTVKKTMPKLKVSVEAFNSFYSFQSRQIIVTGGTVTDIRENTAKAAPLPDWLILSGDNLILQKALTKSTSGKAYLLVDTEEWAIPAEVALTVKNTYKIPGLKLSATTVTLSGDADTSKGIELRLQTKNKKESLESLNVAAVTVSSGYRIEEFDLSSGSFILKATETVRPGKISLLVSVRGTENPVTLPLTVKTASVSLKLSAKTVTLNTAVNDSAVVKVTATPADYDLSDLTVQGYPEDLDVTVSGNEITIRTTEETAADTSCKLTVSAGGSETILTVKTIAKEPTVTLKAKGTMDLSFPDQAAVVTPTFKNYSGSFELDTMTAVNAKKEDANGYFLAEQDGTTIRVTCTGETVPGTYTLTLGLKLSDDKIYSAAVKVTVKRTPVKLKLTPAKVSLNKTVGDTASVAVTCTTKGYNFIKPTWELMDKTGKNSAEGALEIGYSDGQLNLAVNETTEYGATYKLLVKADEKSPAATLTITIPAESKSVVKSSLKASGSIDVIRDGTAIIITPSYKNCGTGAEKQETLYIYSSADKYVEPVNDLFCIEKDAQGRYILTGAEGMDHSKTYKAQLVTTFGEATVKSSLVSLKVKMGSAKVTLETSGTLFAKDKNSRIRFSFRAADAALNGVKTVTIKDAKYQDKLEVLEYGNGSFAIGFKDGSVDSSLIGKTITVTLNLFLDGNETQKANTAAKLKLAIQK